MFASGDSNDHLNVYSFNSSAPQCSYRGFNTEITCVCFNNDEDKVVGGSYGGTIVVYDVDREKGE